MPTTRTAAATQSGPVTFDVELTAGAIHVTVEDRPYAEVTVTTADDDGSSADAVNQATITDTNGRLTVRLPRTPGGGTIIQQAYGRGGVTVVQTAGSVYGSVIGVVSGDVVMVGGGRTVHAGSGAVVQVGGSPIRVHARLPLGSSLTGDTTSADFTVEGPLERAEVRSVSGDVRLDAVRALDANTTSGDVKVARFAGTGRAKSVSGDIRIGAAEPSTLRARTVSGDIRVTGARVDLDASTVSGRVTNH